MPVGTPVFRGAIDQVTTPITYTDAPIGTQQDNDRLVVAIVTWSRSGSPNRTLSSVTFGGVAGTIEAGANIINDGTGGDVVACAIAWKVVNSGTTCTISTSFSGTCQSLGLQIYTIDLNGASPTPHAVAESISGALSINIPSGGALIAGALFQNAPATMTWSGATEDQDSAQGTNHTQYGCASAGNLSAETNRSVSATGSGGFALVAASWGPAPVEGTMAASETGADDFTASGTVLVSGSMAAVETGADDFTASGTVEPLGGGGFDSLIAIFRRRHFR